MTRPYRSHVDYSVLGPLRVSNGQGLIEIRGVKERTLLAHLISAGGRLVPSAELIDSLWQEDPPPSAGKSLQTFVLRLRNAIEPERQGSPQVLLTEGPGYRLAVDPGTVDAERFTRLVTVGRRALEDGRPESASTALGEALEMWRGPAYAGFDHARFAQAEARRLEELRLAATEDQLGAEIALGHLTRAIPELERLVGANPLRERLWEMLMLALYRDGRQGEALTTYERARATLADELGVDPGAGLRALHGKVLAHDPGLRPTAPRLSLPAELSGARPRTVGRDAELDRLRQAWERALRSTSTTVLVRGPAGAGASALAADLAAEVARSGAEVRFESADSPADPTPLPPGRPLLVVTDHAPTTTTATMVLSLAGPHAPADTADEVLDLIPLTAADVREVLTDYLSADAVDAAVEPVLARSHGWPGAVHEAAITHARALATQRVGAAARRTDESSTSLASARADLVDSVVDLRETAGRDREVDPTECPWRGLASYDVDDARWYAGRERLVAELVARIASSRVLALVGASGSGKSSALRAGLVASLAADVLPGSAAWSVVVLRPGPHPLRALARTALGRGHAEVGDLISQLIRADNDTDATTRTVVVVDQFEEVWTVCADDTERQQFLDTLAELATDPRSDVSVVLALRADWTGELAGHAALASLVGDATVLVGAPTAAEIRRTIDRPAAAAGLRLDEGLADTVVSDAGAEPGILPLLSTALAQLWEQREDANLTYAAYVRMGGLNGAIATLAEECFDGLTAEQQVSARALLLRLTGPGEGTAVTRRRVPMAELETLSHSGVRAVVEELASARLLTVSDGHVEVAHEALFREWPRLQGWLVEDAAGRAVQRRLAMAASEWDAEGREATGLWSGTRLSSGLEVAQTRPGELTTVEHEFLDTSREASESAQREVEERAASTARQNRRLRWLVTGIAAVLAVALVAGLLAWRSRQEAAANAVSADARQLAATSLNMDYPDIALLTAIEATKLEQSPETYGGLLTLLARQPSVVHRVRTTNRFLRNAVSPDGRTVYVSENEGRLWSIDAQTGETKWQVDTPEDGQVANLGVTPDGTGILGTLGRDPTSVLTRFDARDGSVVWELSSADLPDDPAAEGPPYLHWGGFDASGTFHVQTDTRLYAVDPTSGTVRSSVAWPAYSKAAMEDLVIWPDGRASRGAGFEPDSGSVVIDTRGKRAPARVAGEILAASPKGDRAAVITRGASGQTVKLIDTATLKDVGTAVPLDGDPRAGSWSRDGTRLAVGSDATVTVFDVATMDQLHQLEGHKGTVLGAVFAGPDEDLLWTAGRDGTAVGFDLSGTRTIISDESIESRAYTGEAPVSGDVGVTVHFYDDKPNTAELVNLVSGAKVADLPVPDADECACQVTTVAMVPDGRTALVSAHWFTEDFDLVEDRGALYLWDVASRTQVGAVSLPEPAFSLDVSSDGSRAVANGARGVMSVDLGSKRVTGHLRDVHPEQMRGDQVPQIALSPDGRLAAVARVDALVLVDVATMREVRRIEGLNPEKQLVGAVTWSKDGETVIAGDFAGWLRFLRADTLEPAAPKRLIAAGFVIGATVSPDGSVLATLGTDGDLTLWDTATWRPYGKPVVDEQAWGFVHFPDAQHVQVLYDTNRKVRLSVDRDAWVAAACSAANRNLTADEAAIVLPGRPVPTTCPT